jgi:hypothetical protein
MTLGYIEVNDHPLTVALRKNYSNILIEFENLSNNFLRAKPNNLMGEQLNQLESNGKELYNGKIDSVFTRVVADSCSEPEYCAVWGTTEESRIAGDARLKVKQQMTPILESIILPYSNYLGCVGFNIMHPNSKLSKHYGMVSKYVRFHLGIKCDPEAKFIVNNYAPRAWEDGKVWAFDDGDSYHGTTHNGTETRVILIVDIDRAAFTELKEEVTWG